MMNDNGIDMDALFNGASVVLGAVQNTVGAAANGINDVRNIMDSRRNMGQPQQNNPMYSGYQQPVSYGYGYSDTGGYGYPNNYSPIPVGANNYCMNGGYPGFTNPGYGSTGGTVSINKPQGGAWG